MFPNEEVPIKDKNHYTGRRNSEIVVYVNLSMNQCWVDSIATFCSTLISWHDWHAGHEGPCSDWCITLVICRDLIGAKYIPLDTLTIFFVGLIKREETIKVKKWCSPQIYSVFFGATLFRLCSPLCFSWSRNFLHLLQMLSKHFFPSSSLSSMKNCFITSTIKWRKPNNIISCLVTSVLKSPFGNVLSA